MHSYNYPLQDAEFIFGELLSFDDFCNEVDLQDLGTEMASVILTEAAKLGSDVLAPLNRAGDTQGAKLGEKGVEETPGFKEAYQQFVDNGWNSLSASVEYGGQGLPAVLCTGLYEILQSSNLSFSLCPGLTRGAIEAVEHHGTDELKQTWLPKMISGEWTGTMNLTEPDAGTDLAAVKSKAVPEGDHYLITGQKIFITWGDHQMTDNIVHLVLARLPDAPAGVKGISLFLVPKFLLDENGNPGKENDVRCVSIEHKLGIHGSPTCVMSYGDNGGAIGYLIGEPHNGLACMFTMMNDARQMVGSQGLGVSERAYQQAVAYAKDRLQGTNKDGSRFNIIKFPDVRRMLMLMKSANEAMRALLYTVTQHADYTKYSSDEATAMANFKRSELFTPIVKGWLTEMSMEITSLGIQVHGGMGFIEETGAAQHYRDARILPIYEGTNGVQALDFVGRKTIVNGGEQLGLLLDDIQAVADELTTVDELKKLGLALADAVAKGRTVRQTLLDQPKESAAISFNTLMMFGYICGAWVMGKSALKAYAKRDQGDFYTGKLVTCQFYFEHHLPRINGYMATIEAGSESTMALAEESF